MMRWPCESAPADTFLCEEPESRRSSGTRTVILALGVRMRTPDCQWPPLCFRRDKRSGTRNYSIGRCEVGHMLTVERDWKNDR